MRSIHLRTVLGRTIKVHTSPADTAAPHAWDAIDDNYDGAPDAGFQPIGTGATEEEAIADLLAQIEEHDA